MILHLNLKTSLVVAAAMTFTAAYAQTMPKADYKAAKATISAAYKADKTACAPMKSNAKDVCMEEGKAKEKVALAELEYAYTGKPADMSKIAKAKAESAYAVAKEKCDDLAGNAKDVCVKEAKAVEVKALADAKMGKEIGAARKDASTDKLDADYKVAIEKCDALAGDVKASCITAAKVKFGKT